MRARAIYPQFEKQFIPLVRSLVLLMLGIFLSSKAFTKEDYSPKIESILWEKGKTLSIYEVLSQKSGQAWEKPGHDTYYFGLSHEALWVKFQLPDSLLDKEGLLLIRNPSLHLLDLYMVDQESGDINSLLQSGNAYGEEEKPFSHRAMVFPIKLQPKQLYYLRAVAGDEMVIPMS
ncbi:MAG: 7TM-DISM domain-containing protein, partial [Bacteroidota bacterium]